jgi:hypothetical protein
MLLVGYFEDIDSERVSPGEGLTGEPVVLRWIDQ